jgi:hypothetical protein
MKSKHPLPTRWRFSKDRNSSVVFVHFWGALQREKVNGDKDSGNVLTISRLNFQQHTIKKPAEAGF